MKRAIRLLACAALVCLHGPQAGAGEPMIAFGAAWYPEQWPQSRWDADLALMEQAHVNTVRIAEFAWSTLEPEEGRFDFGWLDAAIAAAARHHIRVVLGTPTAAPPIWLTERYADVRRVDENGTVAGHGGRRHFSFASSRYRQFAQRIAGEMARRYGHNPNVIGWQIDNEIGPPSFDAEARAHWADFLKDRYGRIERLNQAWNTAYWSQTYQRFESVPLRLGGGQNPSLLLDVHHFFTAEWTSYIRNQAETIRAHADARQFITTNTMHWNAGFDHFALHKGLDMAAWDNYITTPEPDWIENGANHDLVRGYKQKNFWVMESQVGRIDWVAVNRALRPGQMREMGWQAVMHGADGLLYWQWRAGLAGQETNYGTLLGVDSKPVPAYGEAAKLGAEFALAAPALADTKPEADVAFLWSYDSNWALDMQPMHRDFDPVKLFLDLYRPIRNTAQGVDVIAPEADLSRYRLVVAPSLNVLTSDQAARLAAYVRGGGHLLIGPRTGQKNEANSLWTIREPGPLATMLGAHVEQSYALDGKVSVEGLNGAAQAGIWADALVADAGDVTIQATYRDPGGWLDGRGALVSRREGQGTVTALGAWLDAGAMGMVVRRLMEDSGVKPRLGLTGDGVEIGLRQGGGRRILIAINHGDQAQDLPLPAGARPIVGKLEQGRIGAHDVIVAQLGR